MLHSYNQVWCIIFFQLQDLAVTPGLRDPRLNFAESVIEGHIPDMKTTDRSYLRVVLWFSFLCPMFFGPFLYFWVLQYLKDDTQGTSLSAGSDGNRSRVDYICRRNEEPLICSVTLFCCFLLLIEVIFVLAKVRTSTEISKRGNTSRDFIVLLALIPEWLVRGYAVVTAFVVKIWILIHFWADYCLLCARALLLAILVGLQRGIMVNPAWGVSILPILSFFCITLFFVINETTHANEFRLSTLFTYTPGFLGLCFVVAPPVLVGQSFYGRETAVSVYVRVPSVSSSKMFLLWF